MSDIIIRPETPADWPAAEAMVRRAFWNIHWPGCNEHLLVRVLHESADLLPAFSRVAEMDGRIVGAIYYSKAWVVDGEVRHELATFGPLAVEPMCQGLGIGRMLLEATLPLLREAGIPGVIIMGEPRYYPRLGFRHCGEFGIVDAMGNCWDAMLAYPLDEAAFAQVHGVFCESEDIAKCDDAERLAEMETHFPAYPKVKLQEGFLQTFDERMGEVALDEAGQLAVRVFELALPAALDAFPADAEKPRPGDIVRYRPGRDGKAHITRVCENLWRE